MQGTAKTFMVAQPEAHGPISTSGGFAMYYGRWMNLIGFQHAIATLGVHFKEQAQEDTVRAFL
eukprot:5535995-Prorocentrum_lima.AAC.1